MKANQPIRIIQVLKLNVRSGLSSMVMNLYRHIDREKVQFDFITWGIDLRANYIDEVKALGATVYVLPNYREDFFGFNRETRKILLETQCVGIHCHEYLVSLVFLYWAKKAKISLRIAHSHNPTIESLWKRELTKLTQGWFQFLATDFFACSEEAGIFLFGKGTNVRIIKNAIDSEQYKFSEEIRTRLRENLHLENCMVVGTVGRLTVQKNPFFLLEVFLEVNKRNPASILLWIGEGPLKKQLEDKIKQYKLENKVVFLGTRQDVPDLMQAMDIFLFPSLYEGFGIVLLEAQASGLPCFTSTEVPKETQISNHIKYISLKEGASEWAEQIIQNSEVRDRTIGANELETSPFCIQKSAAELQKFYIDHC